MSYRLLVINPGSTSTKIGVYEDENEILGETLIHSSKEIGNYNTICEQFNFRKSLILDIFNEKNFDINSLDAVVGRGGLLKPMESGTYLVNDVMINDLKIGLQGEHASNLGGIMAGEIGKIAGIPSFIVDPVVVDELQEVARVSGMPEIKRVSIFHALNQKAIGKRYAKEIGRDYKNLNLIVVHMGGGVSVGAHKGGRVIDVNNALDGEGPFSPERSGGIPALSLVRLCFSGEYTIDEINKKVTGNGGVVEYLNTNDFREVEKMAKDGNKKAKLIIDAFVYQVSKEIGAYSVVLNGKVDAILLTGGIAYSKDITKAIEDKVGFISEVILYPGEDELLALAQGGLRVLKGEEDAKEYK
ncbi:butyrate kinase [Clostridium sp.]|uniref:butyrate kinase n=1 Tax=Clostridium sp. TaxID=1506 RepID=UPI0026153314|nr:butyrate kinase [Clostridium sp.]